MKDKAKKLVRVKPDNNGPKGLDINESVYKKTWDEFSKRRSIFTKLDNEIEEKKHIIKNAKK